MTEDSENTAQVQPGTAVSPSATPVAPPPVGVTPPAPPPPSPRRAGSRPPACARSYGVRLVVKEGTWRSTPASGRPPGPTATARRRRSTWVVGLARADAGDIRIDGQPISAKPIHQRSRLGLSYLPQEVSIFRKLTVDENIRAVLELQYDANGKALKPAEIDKRLDGLLNDLSLTHLRDSPAPRCPAANAVASRSRARSRRSRASSCSTSPSPASTRSRSSRSSASSAS